MYLSGTNLDLRVLPKEGDPKKSKGSDKSDEDSSDESADKNEGSSDGDDSDDDSSDEGSEGDGDPSDGEGEEGDGDGDPSDGEGEEGEPTEGEGKGGKGHSNSASDKEGKDSEKPSKGAGGSAPSPKEFENLATELIREILSGAVADLKDVSSALAEALVADAKDLRRGEQEWRPFSTDADTVSLVTGGNPEKAREILDSVRSEIAYLRSQLRTKFLQARKPEVVHGVRKGRELSERRLVASAVELRSGRSPTRPDWTRVEKEACTLRAAVVLDESSSMGPSLALKAAAAGLAIATPLDELGVPCLVVGPRNGSSYDVGGKGARYHRSAPVLLDVFKNWDERMRTALPRFSQVRHVGSTPLEDGIQYALTQLNESKERYRVCFVVTDGRPDNPGVVRRQIRLAAEAGVYVVGVGIAAGCEGVRGLFPLHVAVTNVKELPQEMMKILTSIMFPTAARKMELDAKFTPTYVPQGR